MTSANAADNSITVMDLLTKKPVVVKVTTDSQLRKLPQMMAQRIAMRLKGQTPDGQPAAAGTPPACRRAGRKADLRVVPLPVMVMVAEMDEEAVTCSRC